MIKGEQTLRMDNRILQSVIEITRQCDTDSLEYGFVKTLAKVVPCRAISICKLHKQNVFESLEEIIHLTIDTKDSGENHFEWRDEVRSLPINTQIETCLTQAKTCIEKMETGFEQLLIPIIFKKETLGLVILEGGPDISGNQDLIEGLVKIYENYLTILNESECDNLTSLFNRRTFDKKLNRLLQAQKKARKEDLASGQHQARRRLEPNSFAWLAILDIDHFKRVNDTYGHVYGDEVLLVFSQKMKSCFRSSDLLFRFGGEEFLVVLEPIPFENANSTLERFRQTVADHDFPLVGKVTISIGFVKITEDDYPPTVLEYADKALYYAKEHGRNSVYSYESLLEKGKLTEEENSGSVDLF